MTQADRVLAALRRAGDRGILATAFSPPNVVDHGKPIYRVAARVLELRACGFEIETIREPSERVARYRLHTTGTPAQPSGALPAAGPPRPAATPAGAPRPGAGAAPLAEPDASPAGEGAASLFDLDTYRRKPRGFGDPEAA